MPFITRPWEAYCELGKGAGLETVDYGQLDILGYPSRALGASNNMLEFKRSEI